MQDRLCKFLACYQFCSNFKNGFVVLVLLNVYLYDLLDRQFQGSDEQHSTEIVSSDVVIIPSAGNHDKSSSHVKTNNIVDHSWDVRFYKGQLLAVHLSGKFIAFGIQGLF